MRERWRMPRTGIQQASAGILGILFGSAGHRAKNGGSARQLATVVELEPERASSGWAIFEAWVGAMGCGAEGAKGGICRPEKSRMSSKHKEARGGMGPRGARQKEKSGAGDRFR